MKNAQKEKEVVDLKFELQAEKCLFIDDNLQNVMAARHNGMKAICFKDASQLRALLLEN